MTDDARTNLIDPTVPEYAQVVLVPIANPATIADLLHLAGALIDPEHGKIIALSVSMGDDEQQEDAIDATDDIIQELVDEGLPIQLDTVVATSISRGILDKARESGADLIIIGSRSPQRGEVVLGSVVENVIETAPCDVLVYRIGEDADYQRIVVPVDDVPQARVAARIAIRLAEAKSCRIEAMRPQTRQRSQFEGLAIIEQSIAELPGNRRVKRTVVTSGDPVDGILARTEADDLIIVGFSSRNEFERMMFGDVSRGLLDRAEGPVILISRSLEKESVAQRFTRRFVNYLRPELTRTEQESLVRQARVNARPSIDYTVMILVSAALASLGLLLNSSAVIIGAMLVAPLMSPLVALSTGLTVGRVRVAARAVVTLALGVLMALVVGYTFGAVLPRLPTAEMLSRGSPTLLDAAIALASGVAGAYATARKDIPAALAGVAIAAALMPPLCTVGLAAALGEPELATGAGVLFLTNIFCITLAGIGTFLYLGMTFRRYDDVSVPMQVFGVFVVILAAVPVGMELMSLSRQSTTENLIRRELNDFLPDDVDLISLEFFRRDEPTRVVATVRTALELTPSQTDPIEQRIASQLGESVRLEMVVLRVVRLDVDPDPPPDTLPPEATPERTPEMTLEPSPAAP